MKTSSYIAKEDAVNGVRNVVESIATKVFGKTQIAMGLANCAASIARSSIDVEYTSKYVLPSRK